MEESLLVVYRHGLVPVLLQEVGGCLRGDSHVQVTVVLLIGFCLLVLMLRVAVLIHRVTVVLLYEKVLTWVLKAGNGIYRAYFEVPLGVK